MIDIRVTWRAGSANPDRSLRYGVLLDGEMVFAGSTGPGGHFVDGLSPDDIARPRVRVAVPRW